MKDVFGRDPEKEVKINRFKLEIECEQHSSLFLYWSDTLAEERKKLDTKKLELEGAEAMVELEYRKEYLLKNEKTTEGQLKARVNAHEGLVKIKKDLIDQQYKVNQLMGVVSSFEHRRSQLKQLTELWIGGYYANPTAGRTGTDQASAEIRKKLNEEKKDEKSFTEE